MGRTYRGLRKEFGTKKSHEHKTRSKWNAKNGTRLRTLAIDLEEFKLMEANGESLHRPPDASLKTNPVLALLSSERPQKTAKPVVVPSMNITQVLKTKSKARPTELWGVEVSVLQGKLDYAARQTSYISKLLQKLQKLKDPSFAKVIARLTNRKKHWDGLTGKLGEHLWERALKESNGE